MLARVPFCVRVLGLLSCALSRTFVLVCETWVRVFELVHVCVLCGGLLYL